MYDIIKLSLGEMFFKPAIWFKWAWNSAKICALN